MPQYLFQRGHETREVSVSMADIARVSQEMAAAGWRRVFTAPALHVYPVTWSEALEWAEADTARAEQEWAVRSDQLFKEAVSQVPRAEREGLLSGDKGLDITYGDEEDPPD